MTMTTLLMLTALIVAFTPLRGPAETVLSLSVLALCGVVTGLILSLVFGLILLTALILHAVLMLAGAVKTAALKNLNWSRTDVR